MVNLDMAFCDMTSSGGGWELVLRASSSSSVFTWDSEYWTSDSLLNSDVDSKFRIGNNLYLTTTHIATTHCRKIVDRKALINRVVGWSDSLLC